MEKYQRGALQGKVETVHLQTQDMLPYFQTMHLLLASKWMGRLQVGAPDLLELLQDLVGTEYFPIHLHTQLLKPVDF